MRKYEVAYLAADGDGHVAAKLAPATALFEAPFMAFARGTLITTPDGPTAIEDIQPGMKVNTIDAGAQPVLWKGATTLVPGAAGQSEEAGQLTRIAQNAMGVHHPSHDLLLGFGARLYQANRGLMVPANDLIDGEYVFAVRPPSPVRVFHLALKHHGCIRAADMVVESFHPGDAVRHMQRPEIKTLYLSLFPHLRDLAEFGPLRVSRQAEEQPDLY
ncbi:MAG: Hint domain-containing protein [Pseudomonadota bacterium]